MLIVQKFGGSSLAGAERLRRAASIIADSADAGNKVVAVVSARGDMTDELLGEARRISADAPARELDALLSCGETGSAGNDGDAACRYRQTLRFRSRVHRPEY